MADLQVRDKVRSIIKAKIEKIFFFFWKGEGVRRVLENTPSKHEQLGRSFGIIVILSLHCTGVVLALFQVPAFDRLYIDTLNNISYHICVYIRWINYFKFNVFFTYCCDVWVMWHLMFFSCYKLIFWNFNHYWEKLV